MSNQGGKYKTLMKFNQNLRGPCALKRPIPFPSPISYLKSSLIWFDYRKRVRWSCIWPCSTRNSTVRPIFSAEIKSQLFRVTRFRLLVKGKVCITKGWEILHAELYFPPVARQCSTVSRMHLFESHKVANTLCVTCDKENLDCDMWK